MEKMTIHRALAELKLLDARIEKATTQFEPSGFMQEGKLVNNFHKEEDFEKDVKSKFQSINDLIDRKDKIKSAIVQTNCNTDVTVSGVTMTISDAITFKNTIAVKKNFIISMQNKHNEVKANIERTNTNVNNNALQLAEAAVGKDNVKLGDNDVSNVTAPYLKANTYHLVDPLNVESLIDGRQEKIDNFESEVDAVLSEINATTFIEI